jgi:hypothetical protein
VKIAELFQAGDRRLFSFEFFPPKTDAGEQTLMRTIARLRDLQPSFVSVTYPAVWVQHFTVSGPDDYSVLEKGLADMLISDAGPAIKKRCDGVLVEREHLDVIIAEQKLSQSRYADPSQRIPSGHLIGHNRVVSGTLTISGATATLTVTVTNTTTGTTTGTTGGPTTGSEQPPRCDAGLSAGESARLNMHMSATVDLRPVGSIELTGLRVGRDMRWLGYAATTGQLGQFGSARIGDHAWTISPGTRWAPVDPASVDADTVDRQALDLALTPELRATAEDRGVEVIEGARARRCRVAGDGLIFEDAFPEVVRLVDKADLHRWRGQLDYWVFLDGQLGQIAGSINGEAAEIVPEALNGTVDVRMTATERGRDTFIYPPTP